MASEQHKKLATIIKGTHNRLREESRVYGPEEAWQRNLGRTENLQNYAASMQELATAHWSNASTDQSENTRCRIQWIKKQCYDYFFSGGKEKYNQREVEIIAKGNIERTPETFCPKCEIEEAELKDNKISVLDVGSCYNPLGDDENFDVTAVDLAPYSDRVFKCDFLNTIIASDTIFSTTGREILQIKKASYDACVFSLLLEYLPCPEQRFQCCKRAYDVLKDAGIFIIITPDSKHVGANAKIMKSWRFVLAKLGFMRIKYEKLQHIHCICFRKCITKNVAQRWVNLQNFSIDNELYSTDKKIYIPQDFQEIIASKEDCEKVNYPTDDIATVFHELPDLIN